MTTNPNERQSKADKNADDLIAQLRDVPGVVEIYSEGNRGGVLVTAFVESEQAEVEAIELELALARRDLDSGVELRVYQPTPEVRADYRAIVPETLEWSRDSA